MRKENDLKKELAVAAVTVLAGLLLLTAMARAEGSSLKFFGPISRVITPNGDGNNDAAFLCFDNPADSDISGRIYTLLGSEVAVLGPVARNLLGCPAGSLGIQNYYLSWDGRSNGNIVGSGIYVYRIQAENHIYSGTILVVR